MRCRRPNGTFYGTAGQCRKGTEAAGEDWRESELRKFPDLNSYFDKLDKALEGVEPESRRDLLNERINKTLVETYNVSDLAHTHAGKTGEAGRPYSKEEQQDALKSMVNNWTILVGMDPPDRLKLRNGEVIESPSIMIPTVTPSGQKGYINPENGRVFNFTNGRWSQNRAGGEDTERYIPAISSFRSQQGAKWPTQTLPPRTDIDLTGDNLYNSLTPAERKIIFENGLPFAGTSPAFRVREYYAANPGEIDQRVREVVERYKEQGGRSGVSGLPIAIPGLPPKPGEGKSTVDHFNPASSGKSLTPAEIRQKLDNGKNFLLAEEGPNTNRSNGTWGNWFERVVVPYDDNKRQKEETRQNLSDGDKKTYDSLNQKIKSGYENWKTLEEIKKEDLTRGERNLLKTVGPPEIGAGTPSTSAIKSSAPKTESSSKPVALTPSQSVRSRLTNDQKSQLSNAISRMGRLQENGLSESEALDELTTAQRALYNQFIV